MCVGVGVVGAGGLTEYDYKSAFWRIIRVIKSLFCYLGKTSCLGNSQRAHTTHTTHTHIHKARCFKNI